MILFGVIDDDVVNLVKINLGRQGLHKFPTEMVIHGIDQHIFLFADEIAVVAGALDRVIFSAVELPHLPIALPNPVDIVFDMNGHTDDSFVQSPTSNELVIALRMPIFILLFFIVLFLLIVILTVTKYSHNHSN